MDEFDLVPGSLAGRTIIITGANTGLGRESAIRLARVGATVVITARTDEKGREAETAIRKVSGSDQVFYQQLDLADLKSVRAFCDRFQAQPYGDRVDVLMNNAGVMAIPTRMETRDGFERQFGVNHLGHFALTALLFPLLKKARDTARVINLSSSAQLGATKEIMEGGPMDAKVYTQWGAYCQSKLANVLFAKELDRRFKEKGIKATAVSCHPGGVDTDLARYLVTGDDDPGKAKELRAGSPWFEAVSTALSRTVQLGANTQIFLAAGADGGLDKSGGEYFDNMRPGLLNSLASDERLAKQLWEESEKLTGVAFEL
jgi:NAD(P)-dependent dehydrogenase (short-subunit alcohol dehydrogenase family)